MLVYRDFKDTVLIWFILYEFLQSAEYIFFHSNSRMEDIEKVGLNTSCLEKIFKSLQIDRCNHLSTRQHRARLCSTFHNPWIRL